MLTVVCYLNTGMAKNSHTLNVCNANNYTIMCIRDLDNLNLVFDPATPKMTLKEVKNNLKIFSLLLPRLILNI